VLSVQVSALGVAAGGHSAWHRRDVFRVWVDGVERTTTGQVTGGDLVVSRNPVPGRGSRAE
jgi:hypothetical protein